MSDGGPQVKNGYSDWPETAIQAVADAWASIDGKRDKFRAGRGKPWDEQPGGYYDGYTADAESMIERLRRRGYTLTKCIPYEGKVT